MEQVDLDLLYKECCANNPELWAILQRLSHTLPYSNAAIREGNGTPTSVLLPGKSHGWRSLVGCSPWGRKESDMTEQLHFHFSLLCIGEGNGSHSSVLAWRIPGTGEPGWLPSMGSPRVGHDWSDLASVAVVMLLLWAECLHTPKSPVLKS